jgi:hypothetical protein
LLKSPAVETCRRLFDVFSTPSQFLHWAVLRDGEAETLL